MTILSLLYLLQVDIIATGWEWRHHLLVKGVVGSSLTKLGTSEQAAGKEPCAVAL